MAKLFIPFGSYNADGPAYQHPTRWNDIVMLENYDDVIPSSQNSARPRQSLSVVTTPALTGKALGCISIRAPAGADFVFAGDATKLYKATSTSTATFTFSDVSVSGGYSTGAGELWEFAEWQVTSEGTVSQSVIATNFSDLVQRIFHSPASGSTTVTFQAMITSPAVPPRARHIGVIGQFVVLGNIQTISASTFYSPSRVWWSAFGSAGDFTPSATTQCDYEDLSTGGPVQKIVGGNEYGYIFQTKQIQVMRYVGGATIFDFSPINYAEGTPIPSSVITYDGGVYYISHQGFHAIYGTESKNIGNNLVDRDFWSTVEKTRLHDISVASDPINKIVWWAFPTSTAGYADKMLGYKIDDGRWVRWNQTLELLAQIRGDQAEPKFIAFNTDHKLCTFTSDAYVKAQFETKALQPVPGRRWQVNGARVLMGGSGVMSAGTCQAKVYDTPLPSAAPSFTTSVNINPENNFPMRVAGRYIKLHIELTPGSAVVNSYIGMEIDYEVLGER